MQQPVDMGWGKISHCHFVASWRDACPCTSGAKAVTLCPEDVSDSALCSSRVEGQQGVPGFLAREELPPIPLLSNIPAGLIPE